MTVKNWHVKDITFTESERRIVAVAVKGLIAKGWELYDGEIIDGCAFGNKTVIGKGEEIQLHKIDQ